MRMRFSSYAAGGEVASLGLQIAIKLGEAQDFPMARKPFHSWPVPRNVPGPLRLTLRYRNSLKMHRRIYQFVMHPASMHVPSTR